jgi:hypothetical protein
MLIPLTARASAWILQAAATLPDTIVTRQIVERGWFDQVTHVATGLLTLLLLAAAVAVLPAALYLRQRLNQLSLALEGVRSDNGPLVNRTSNLLENAEAVSKRVRDDVERLSDTLAQFDGQLREIADIAGDRVRDFDALLGAVQEEAEGLFLTTTSAARGIRAGVRALRRHRSRSEQRAARRAATEAAEALESPDADADTDDTEPRSPEPRLRRRRHAT